MARTISSWYSDPVVRGWYPDDAQRAVPVPDAEELERLQRLNESLVARVAAQSELLTRRAGRE
jgi:hypothetical protein